MHTNSDIIISLDAIDVGLAHQLAQRTHEKWKNHSGHYENSFNSHLIGRLGEIGAARWLEHVQIKPERLFEDQSRENEADIIAQGHRLEVKTWTKEWWPDYGRCVAVNQFEHISSKADLILWCSVLKHTPNSASIQIIAWSTLADVQMAPKRFTGPSAKKKVYNHQLDAKQLRNVNELLDELNPASRMPQRGDIESCLNYIDDHYPSCALPSYRIIEVLERHNYQVPWVHEEAASLKELLRLIADVELSTPITPEAIDRKWQMRDGSNLYAILQVDEQGEVISDIEVPEGDHYLTFVHGGITSVFEGECIASIYTCSMACPYAEESELGGNWFDFHNPKLLNPSIRDVIASRLLLAKPSR